MHGTPVSVPISDLEYETIKADCSCEMELRNKAAMELECPGGCGTINGVTPSAGQGPHASTCKPCHAPASRERRTQQVCRVRSAKIQRGWLPGQSKRAKLQPTTGTKGAR